MPYLHLAQHPNGEQSDPKMLLLHYPNLYRWVSIPANCQKCHQPISALISRHLNRIYALACPVCSSQEL